jgi:hypothetical protein
MMKRHLLLVVLALAAVFAVACDESPESGRAVVAVSDVNGGAPVSVSIASALDADISMTFRWRPYWDMDNVITEAYPHGDIIIEHYRITWTRMSAGSGVIAPREESTQIFVPVYDLVTSQIRVVTAAELGDPSVSAGTAMNANIEFTAREMGTAHEIEFAANFTVHFTN